MGRKKVILKTEIKREKNKLFFCGTSKDGFITIGVADMARGNRRKRKKQQKKTKKKPTKSGRKK